MLQVNHIIGFTEVKPADNLNPQRMAAADQILQKISFGRKIFIDMMKGDPAAVPGLDSPGIYYHGIGPRLAGLRRDFLRNHSIRVLYLQIVLNHS